MNSMVKFFCLWIVVLGVLSPVWSADLNRHYDPVVAPGSTCPQFINVSVNELFVYTFDNGTWQQIPFQIDEKDGGSFFPAATKNGTLDPTDEICFMAADMGDSVQDFQWIDDLNSRAYVRYQISVRDTSVTPATKAYAYVYRSSSLAYTASPYMSYTPPVITTFSDTITGSSYRFAHNDDAIPNYLTIQEEFGGNEDDDLLDRWKVYMRGFLYGYQGYEENEESALKIESLLVKPGPVRVLRKAVFRLVLFGTELPETVDFVAHFYPYSCYVNSFDRDLDQSWGVQVLRQSVDYTANMIGSTFYSEYNPTGIAVNGVDDGVIDKTINAPGINWYMLQGTMGTVATLVKMPAVGLIQELYYRDDLTPKLSDTGIPGTIGESGIQVSSFPGVISGTYRLETMFYYLGPDHTPQIVDSLITIFSDSLDVAISERTFVVPVELSSFVARARDDRVELRWSTASESNNYGFEIERKTESTVWQTVGFVEGAGTTNDPQFYQFTDENLDSGEYLYRLKQLDTNGAFEYSSTISASVTTPDEFILEQNYPNPFNPTTEIAFHIPSDYSGEVRLNIYNLIGQKIRTLVKQNMDAGIYRVQWDGLDDDGQPVGSGAYIYRLLAGSRVKTKKMIKLQ